MKKVGWSSILVAVLALGAMVRAQQAAKIPQIGYLEGGPLSAHTSRMEAFRQGLRERGYEEGKTLLLSGDLATAKSIVSRRLRAS